MEPCLNNKPIFILCSVISVVSPGWAQTIVPTLDPSETAGHRPYEMAWAHRTETSPPTIRFDNLSGWSVQVSNGAQASLELSRAQNLWDRPVARLRYHGTGESTTHPTIRLTPPNPIPLPTNADSVDLWLFGNRWDWENPPDTPPVQVRLLLRDGDGQLRTINVDKVRWKEWWLMHHRWSESLKPPLALAGIEFAGGWQKDGRELFLDSIRFYHEDLRPLTLQPRPRRNLTLLPGQLAGANTGPGRLPFPVREETILPMNLGGPLHTRVTRLAPDDFEFQCQSRDCSLTYHFNPAKGLSGIQAQLGSADAITLMDGAALRLTDGPAAWRLKSASIHQGIVTATYEDQTILRLRLWQKSLVVDVENPTGQATALDFGQFTGVDEPRPVALPYLTYGGGAQPGVLLFKAAGQWSYASVWPDWYRSNGSEPYAAELATNHTARINGGIRYLPRTDGQRNPLGERLFLTVSPRIEEVMPVIPNPRGLHASQAVDRLWQESWGPENYDNQMKRSRKLRAYGIDKLIQCNHEITWRDGGESFTLRTHAAPGRGGDAALIRYVAHQRSLGWFAGLYSNYTDFAPVNEFWDPDAVQRLADGNWRSAWPRCWALKPLKAVEFDALLAPQLKGKYHSTSAYTDVHTAVSPWGYNDYDARVPGAGTFAQTLYAYGELLRHDSRVYQGPIFSEGTYHWLYAGLADGNYAIAYNGRPLAQEPLLPVFDLYQIHPKECDIGMGWTANFCEAIPNWQTSQNLDRSIDRFLLHTLAYGHIGWLVEEEHGLDRTCRSYYMLQPVQARYGLKAPLRLAYWDGSTLQDVSAAVPLDLPRQRRQLFVEYPGGLQLWLNDHPAENWTVRVASQDIILPPAGWAVCQARSGLLSYSALDGTNRVDYIRSPEHIFIDGRGHWFSSPAAAANGALAIKPMPPHSLEIIRISGTGPFSIGPVFRRHGAPRTCQTYAEDGQRLAAAIFTCREDRTTIEPVPGAIRYVLEFGRLR